MKLTIQAMKMQARWLRRARPQPFGFAPGSAHPALAQLGEAHGAGTLSSGAASPLGLRTAVHTMSVSYGDTADPHERPPNRIRLFTATRRIGITGRLSRATHRGDDNGRPISMSRVLLPRSLGSPVDQRVAI